MKHIILSLVFALSLVSAAASAQLLHPEVTVDLRALPEEAQIKLRGIDSTLTRYIAEQRHPWNRDDGAYDLPVQVSIYFTDYSPNPTEDKYKANIIVTNKGDARYEDKRYEFGLRTPYQPGQAGYDSFFSVIEFYLWIAIANEEDKYEKLGGNPYFDRARQIQLSAASSIYYEGWDKRDVLLRGLTEEKNKLYREFEFFYHTALYYDELRQAEDTKAYMHYALLKLDGLSPDQRAGILESEHTYMATALKNCTYDKGIEALRRMDPAHKDAYDQIFATPETP